MNEAVTILGAGSWGTALAIHLARARPGVPVRLWGHDPAHLARLREHGVNETYLPGVPLPREIEPVADLRVVADGKPGVVLFVTPSKALRSVAEEFAAAGGPAPGATLLSCTKGIEHASGRRMTEILAAVFPAQPVAALSGPSHAEEVARGTPTALVLAAETPGVAERLQGTFNAGALRAYTADDLPGVELGGALKNIYALAAGISDGLGLGDNAKAALVTRSLAEMVRLGVQLGGRRETFQGLSGIGDLMVTCFSRHSRNRGVGERLGRGEGLEAITASTRMVAEGVPTTRSGHEQAHRTGVQTPVLDQVYAVLYEGRAPADALRELLLRDPKPERDEEAHIVNASGRRR